MRHRCITGFALLMVYVSLNPSPTFAQLISPGKLSGVHASLEGITNCTSCHALGQRSTDNARCLDCHIPLNNRIAARRGFHATVSDQNCANCHKEHFGVEFVPVRFDTLTFDHNTTGFELTGGHLQTSCRGCHQPRRILAGDVRQLKGEHNALDRTYLGLLDSCIGCHGPKSPHENQFSDTECGACHTADTWKEAPVFDHGQAKFPLLGKHREVSCASCHPSVRLPGGEAYVLYTGLRFNNCSSCHEDVHKGSFGPDCAGCHSPAGWSQLSQRISLSSFDHETTGFPLVGAHARTDCASCHGKPARSDEEIRISFIGNTSQNSFPRIESANCLSCHVDYHRGELREAPGGAVCQNCHGQHGWYPTTYDIDRHNRESSFALTGAHQATPCNGCHEKDRTRPTFRIERTECRDCHAGDNPHGVQFVDANQVTVCSSCHVTDSWNQASAVFDHDRTDFPLTGRHTTTACEQCHTRQALDPEHVIQVFRGLESSCESCHREDDPHQGQFIGTTCANCHSTDAFSIAVFDHDRTRFSLTGAHRDTACEGCHKQENPPDKKPFTRFRPLDQACEDCHGVE